MTQGKAWRDGRNATKKRDAKKTKEKRRPVKQFKQKKARIIEDDLDRELDSFKGMTGFRQG